MDNSGQDTHTWWTLNSKDTLTAYTHDMLIRETKSTTAMVRMMQMLASWMQQDIVTDASWTTTQANTRGRQQHIVGQTVNATLGRKDDTERIPHGRTLTHDILGKTHKKHRPMAKLQFKSLAAHSRSSLKSSPNLRAATCWWYPIRPQYASSSVACWELT